MNEFSGFVTFFREGGLVMYFMLAVAVLSVAIGAERLIVVSRAGGLNSRKLLDDLLRHVRQGDLASALQCARRSNAPAARVAESILGAAGEDEFRLQAVADDAGTLALAPLSRRIPHLNVLANVATLLGLLGTIAGLITAFSAVGAADPAQRSAFMAAGISTALNATAFGLLIAIPTLMLQGWLVGRVERIAEQVDEVNIRLSRALVESVARPSGGQVVALHAARPGAGAGRAGLAPQGGAQ